MYITQVRFKMLNKHYIKKFIEIEDCGERFFQLVQIDQNVT